LMSERRRNEWINVKRAVKWLPSCKYDGEINPFVWQWRRNEAINVYVWRRKKFMTINLNVAEKWTNYDKNCGPWRNWASPLNTAEALLIHLERVNPPVNQVGLGHR
jgi:hypothetical protein